MIILESERLLFRPHEPADLEAYCAMESDPDVRRYVGGSPRTRADAERKFHEVIREQSPSLDVWATVLKQNSTYIGRSGLYHRLKPDGGFIPGEANLSFYLAREFWGQGLAIEAARAHIHFGFEQLNLARIVANVQVGNDASVHILQKLGFTLIATEQGVRSFFQFALLNPSH